MVVETIVAESCAVVAVKVPPPAPVVVPSVIVPVPVICITHAVVDAGSPTMFIVSPKLAVAGSVTVVAPELVIA